MTKAILGVWNNVEILLLDVCLLSDLYKSDWTLRFFSHKYMSGHVSRDLHILAPFIVYTQNGDSA